MSDMVTARELLDKMVSENPSVDTTEIMIEFAKLHVTKALESAHYQAVSNLDGRAWDSVYEKRFIIKSYSETNIK